MKINVTGNAGAGKSTLSKRLSDELSLPLVEMDRIVWDRGWRKVPTEEQRARLSELIDQDSWVVDGVSRMAREQADLVIFLDFPAHVCAWRSLSRAFFNSFGTREGLPPDCPDWKIAPTLAKIIFNFPRKARKTILADLDARQGQFVIIQNTHHLESFSIPRL